MLRCCVRQVCQVFIHAYIPVALGYKGVGHVFPVWHARIVHHSYFGFFVIFLYKVYDEVVVMEVIKVFPKGAN